MIELNEFWDEVCYWLIASIPPLLLITICVL